MALKQAPRAGDGHRHHGHPRLDGNAEGTGLELARAALFALVAGALGEDDKTPAALHDGGGIVQGLDGSADVIPLDEHTAQQLHPAVEQGDLFQLLLCQNAVGRVQRGQQDGDIIVAAVVAHEHAGPRRDILLPFHRHPGPRDMQDAPAPAGDVGLDDLLHRVQIPGSQGALGPAQGGIVHDHIAKQINE